MSEEMCIPNFSWALSNIKNGKKLSRKGWNGKDQFIYKVDGSTFIVNRVPLNTILPEGTEVTYRPHIDIKTVDGSCCAWFPSQGDLFAEDWVIVE